MKRLEEYEQRELLLIDALQIACGASCEQVSDLLNDSKRACPARESKDSVIPATFDASEELSQLCYTIVRLTKPSTVVETGVGRGVTSCYILQALSENDKGHLYSVELPMLERGARQATGSSVRVPLRSRWTLIFGPGDREMKRLLSKVKNIDMFVHDSNHTYANQLSEYQSALAWLNKGGILVSDDVGNDALLEASERFGCEWMVTRQTKSLYIGIIIR
jgi:predicted O-methyltransferase YrrM